MPASARPPAPSDRLQDVYEHRAERWFPVATPLPDPRLSRKFERVCELIAEQMPCRRYLDAGCGDGRYLVALASLQARPERVTAIDISERILAVARTAAHAAGVEVGATRANLEALPFPDESFDVVLCTQVIEHLLDPSLGLAEIARVLAPGGHAIVTTDHSRACVTKVLNLPRTVGVYAMRVLRAPKPVSYPHRAFTRADVIALVRDAGLEVERIETFRFLLRAPLDWSPAVRALNAIDRRLSPHRLGDLVAMVAVKPRRRRVDTETAVAHGM